MTVAVLALAGCFGESERNHAGKVEWVFSHAAGMRAARESGKPAMLYFTADWCAPCVELKKKVFTDKRVTEASRRLVSIYIDVDKDRETLAAYNVRGIPAIFFLSPTGEILMRFDRERTAAGFATQMNAVADRYPQPQK
jgi:thiol:disulfide interchange protein DsbD